jgi:SpoIID/LytB domain protein
LNGIFIEGYIKGMKELVKFEIDEALVYEVAAFNIFNGNYNAELIKALTVLKRSQLAREIKNFKYASPSNQKLILDKSYYEAFDVEKQKLIFDVVSTTRGIVAVSGNKAVDIFVTECCGGGTSNSEDVLGYRINYLRRVLCEHCSQCNFEKEVNLVEYAKQLNLKGLVFKDSMDGIFNGVERDNTGRIIDISFLGIKMSGEEFAEMFGMESNRVYFMEDSVILRAIGKGIGLGICIEGANNMAEKGKDFKEIIDYYYTGVTFENLDEYKLLNTLMDKKIIVDPGHGGNDKGNIIEGIEEKNVNDSKTPRYTLYSKELKPFSAPIVQTVVGLTFIFHIIVCILFILLGNVVYNLQKISPKEVFGAVISLIGISLLFI